MNQSKDKILLALRRSNGQIGYLSEGITIPEFYELIQPKYNNINILIDFSPIIETLYKIHSQNKDEKIYVAYNSLYNYFQEIQTYTNKQEKLERLLEKCNDFINLIKIEFNKIEKSNLYNASNNEMYDFVKKIEYLSNFYLDAILIYIYTKANLEIISFKNDVVLQQHIDFIREKVYNIYKSHIKLYNQKITNSDFLVYLLFEKEEDFKKHLGIIENIPNEDKDIVNIKLQIFHNSYKENTYNNMNEPIKRIYSEYYQYDYRYVDIADILMNILYKINSINKLLNKLKNSEVIFENDKEVIEQVKQLIKQTT